MSDSAAAADKSSTPAVREDDESKKFSWPPLESSPEVLTTYLRSIGLPSTFTIGEVFGFDEDLLAFIPQPVLGIIVCYERLIPKSEYREEDRGRMENYDEVAFYMHQSKVLDNACGIIACLHAVFNSPVVSVDEASILGRFRKSAESLSPQGRCESLEKNDEFRTAHKTHAARGQSQAITGDQSKVKHHFVAYVLDKDGKRLVELDGTKAGPVVIPGDCGGDVLRASIAAVKGRLERGEISESLSMMTLNLSQD